MSRGSLYRSFAPLHFAAMMLSVIFVGCVDPVGDFEEYQKMARSKASAPPPSCLPAPAEGDLDISGAFVGYCKVNFADPSQALMLRTLFSIKDGQLEANLTPLVTTATSLNDTAGDPPVIAAAPLIGNQFTMKFGLVKISGKANAISGSDIELGDATFKGVLMSTDKVLAELDGGLIKPFALDLNPAGDVCVFVRSPDGVTLPTRPEAAAFACAK
ncbi:MAG: hypothetical protein RMJ98_03415 [Myxococcales bacterium]|nr:hypothetical protein [Polyangiaceae bacterium]MDW8248338.1 hypothetical protein [Myxococcales bacterium]